MKILHVTVQKHHSTGSGVYLKGLVDGFSKLNYEQAVIAGFDAQDELFIKNDVRLYPLLYNTKELNFNVLGMSDIMPYTSTKYKDLSKDMIQALKDTLENLLTQALNEFIPDLIICHHLYLGTAIVKNFISTIPVIGICHGTCLMQLENTDLEKDFIVSNIQKLHTIYALHNSQKEHIIKILGESQSPNPKISILGSGYNPKVFYNKHINPITKEYTHLSNKKIILTFAGKVSKAKGVLSLLKSICKLNFPKDFIEINIVGGCNSDEEYIEIATAAQNSPFNINFIGKVSQGQLCNIFNNSHIFILPSFFEGLPLVILEALACDCRVIVSNLPGIKESFHGRINESGKIFYVDTPKMNSTHKPIKEDLLYFEDRLCRTIDTCIRSILNIESPVPLYMNHLTWDALILRILNNFC